MRFLAAVIFSMLVLGSASAAFIHGEIYGPGYGRLNNTVIRIEGRFTYQLVTAAPNYSISLPEGQYTVSASGAGADGGWLYAEEKITAGAEDQRLDLVLEPASDIVPVYAIALAVAAIVIYVLARRRAKTAIPAPPVPSESSPSPPAIVELDEDAKSVLRALDGMEGRATQKELREMLGFSDAKLSLILTELEQLGHIRKFKRGRANIIRKINPAS